MSFTSLGLADEIVRAVTEHGYTTPTPIQAQAIPAVLAGGDLLAGAQTGTGKTAGFALPILQRLSTPAAAATAAAQPRARADPDADARTGRAGRGKRAHLRQIPEAAVDRGLRRRRHQPADQAAARGVDILVATPGRLLDHMQQGTVDLSQVEILVLDEADRMLDMGFIRDIKRILGRAAEETAEPAVLRHVFRRDQGAGRRLARLARR